MHKCTALRIVSYPIIPSYLCNIFSQYYESVSEARPDGSSAASLLRQTGKRTPERQSEPCTQKPFTDRQVKSAFRSWSVSLAAMYSRSTFSIRQASANTSSAIFPNGSIILRYCSTSLSLKWVGRTNISSSSWKTAYLAGTDEIHLYSAPSGNFLCTWNLYKSNRADR